MPAVCLTHSQAVKCALKYNVFEPTVIGNSVSHIRLSDTLEATHLPRHSSPAALKLDKLMINGESLSALCSKLQDVASLSLALSHLISLIDCAYESDVIIIEYDSRRFEGIEERISHAFRAASISPPRIAYFDLNPQAAALGAATAALSALIASRIQGILADKS